MPASFWKPVLAEVRRAYPEAYFIGEYIHGNYADEVPKSTMDSVTATPSELSQAGWPVYHLHQELVSLRRRHPWLHRARTRVRTLGNEHIVYEASGNGGTLTVALNLSAAPASAKVPGQRRSHVADSNAYLPSGTGVGFPDLRLGSSTRATAMPNIQTSFASAVPFWLGRMPRASVIPGVLK